VQGFCFSRRPENPAYQSLPNRSIGADLDPLCAELVTVSADRARKGLDPVALVTGRSRGSTGSQNRRMTIPMDGGTVSDPMEGNAPHDEGRYARCNYRL